MKHVLIFLVLVLVVVGLLFTISDNKAPRIPDDETHAIFYVEEVCWECHGPEGEVPRKKSHPPKDQCLKCHMVKDDRRRGS